MKYKLLMIFKDELYTEAKRLVPLCYEQNDLLYCSFDKLHINLNNRYEKFEVNFHLILPGLCYLKNNDEDYLKENANYQDLVEHHLTYIKGKKDNYNEDLLDVSKVIATDIVKNKEKYKDESLYSLIPKLAKKYIKFHNDSVDWECIVMILEEEFNKLGYVLDSTNISDLKNF